jgi:hypothetical protein
MKVSVMYFDNAWKMASRPGVEDEFRTTRLNGRREHKYRRGREIQDNETREHSRTKD